MTHQMDKLIEAVGGLRWPDEYVCRAGRFVAANAVIALIRQHAAANMPEVEQQAQVDEDELYGNFYRFLHTDRLSQRDAFKRAIRPYLRTQPLPQAGEDVVELIGAAGQLLRATQYKDHPSESQRVIDALDALLREFNVTAKGEG